MEPGTQFAEPEAATCLHPCWFWCIINTCALQGLHVILEVPHWFKASGCNRTGDQLPGSHEFEIDKEDTVFQDLMLDCPHNDCCWGSCAGVRARVVAICWKADTSCLIPLFTSPSDWRWVFKSNVMQPLLVQSSWKNALTPLVRSAICF